MGFDNECILNLQSLAGEYFCPVCRLLVYPNEALQSQCTHLYCKPCLTYVVSTTRACPYDGYLVTEADSKPLIETNKALSETIGKIAVHCLYHRSGCTWQGPLSDCTSHCSGCAFGNSPVVCNRCGIQIVHRQVQEHAQNCPGVQPQGQQVEDSQEAATTGTSATGDQTQATAQVGTTTSQAQISQTTTAAGQDPNQQARSNSQSQGVSAAVPTPEQLYQQQYQQYYQQFPGYDPYQQYYQQYYPYQQQAVPQQQQPHLQAQAPQMAGQHQAQVYMQPQPQSQQQVHPQSQVQPQAVLQPQPQPFGQPQSHPSVLAPVPSQSQNQAQVNPQPQTHPTVVSHFIVPSQAHTPSQGHPNLQAQPSSQVYQNQSHSQHVQMPQYQQPHAQMQHPQSQFQPQAHSQVPPQHHPVPQSQGQPQPQAQHHLQPHPQTHPLNPSVQSQTPQPSAHAVTGHQSYLQPQPQQQMQLGAPQHTMHVHAQSGPHPALQQPVQMQNQYAQQPSHLRPPQSHATMANQQQPVLLPSSGQVPSVPPTQPQQIRPHAHQPGLPGHQRPLMQPVQQPMPQQYVQQQPFAGQQSGSVHNQIHQLVPFAQQQLPVHSPLRPQGLQSLQQYPQPQQNVALSHSMQPHQLQHLAGWPMMPNHGLQSQPYQQSSVGVQGRLLQLGASQLSASQSDMLRTNNQMPWSSEQQSGPASKSMMSEKQGNHMIETSIDKKEAGSSSRKAAKRDTNDAAGFGTDAAEMKTPKSENDMKPVDDEIKPKVELENKCSLVDACAKEIPESEQSLDAGLESHAAENGEPLTKQMVKEEAPDSTVRLAEHSVLVDKEIQDGPHLKTTPLQEAEHLEEQSGKLHKDKTLPQMQGSSQGPGFNPSAQVLVGGVITDQGIHQLPVNYAPSTFQQRPVVPSVLQAPPGPPHHIQAPGQPPTQFRPQGTGHVSHPGQPLIPPHGPEVLPSGIPGPASAVFGRGSGQYDPPQHSFEPQLVASQGPYNQGHPPPSHAPRLSPNAFDSHGGMMARAPPNGPEAQMGQQHPTNPVEAEMFLNQRPGYMEGRRPETHLPGSMERGPVGQPSGMYSSAYGLHDERFKPLPDEHLNLFPMDPGRRVSDRGEFEEDLKQFPRPTHLDAESVSKFGTYSSRPLDRGPHGFGMDGPPRPHDKGLHGRNFDTGLKLDPMAGSVPLRFLPSYNDAGERPLGLHEDSKGRSENARAHPDFLGSVPGFGRPHMDGSRSPVREYPGISSRGFGSLHGGLGSSHLDLDNVDGREQRRFGLPSHFRRGEYEGPGNFRMGEHMSGDLIGPDVLPSHIRRGEHLGPRGMPGHLRLGEPVGFGPFPGDARGELVGPANFPHPRIGEPGFRSSFSLQGFPNDGGVYTGKMEPFEISRKRKPASMGWCRICKFDCETVEGLDMHSQTREHQKIAMDMVKTIKHNAMKHKSTSNDRTSLDDASKPRKASFEGRGNKN